MLEFLLGSNREKAARDKVQELNRTLNQRGRLNVRQQRQLEEEQKIAGGLIRRQIGLGVTGTALILGVPLFLLGRRKDNPSLETDRDNQVKPPETGSSTDRLRLYPDRSIPPSLISEIAQEMSRESNLSTVSSMGGLILSQYRNTEILNSFTPFTVSPPPPIEFGFRNLRRLVTAEVNQSLKTQEGRLTVPKVDGSGTVTLRGYETKTENFSVNLNTRLLGDRISRWTYYVLLAKEVSSMTFIPEQRQAILRDLRKQLVIPEGSVYEEVLASTAFVISSDRSYQPYLSEYFNDAEKHLDYSGYWAVTLDVLTLKETGRLNEADQSDLRFFLEAGQLCIDRGYITYDASGKRIWSEGFRPFSHEWIRVMDEVYRNAGQSPYVIR